MLKAERIDYAKKKVGRHYVGGDRYYVNARKVFDDVRALGLERLAVVRQELLEVIKENENRSGIRQNNTRRLNDLYGLIGQVIKGRSYEHIFTIYLNERRLYDHLRSILTKGKYKR